MHLMARPKSMVSVLAEELCRKYPEHSSIGLARRLLKEHPEVYPNIEAARTIIRRIRGASGRSRLKYATIPRKKGKAGQVPTMPKSMCEPWTPFEVSGAKRVGIISDVHVPYHSENAWEAAINKLKANKIDTLVINGDYADFYQVSKWEKNPKKRRFSEELRCCVEGLEWMRHILKGVRFIYKLGNHDERWDKFIWQRTPEIYDLPQCQIESLLEFERLGIECVRDQRPIMLGKLPVLHGHELPKGMTSPVNMARGAFLRTIHSMLCGHGHRTSTHVEADMFGKEIAVWSTGMLCDPHPEYQRFGKSNWGFAYVEIFAKGDFGVENYRISSDFKVRTA